MFPHFLGIGAQKAASTWLYTILRKHPQIWIPTTKELHFFDLEGESSHFKKILYKEEKYKRSITRFKYAKKSNVIWNFKYLFTKRNLEHYRRLFTPKKGQICGEITPAYSRLPEHKVRYIHQHMPHVKAIYILRNPIYRDWSSISMFMTRKNFTIETLPDKKFENLLIKRLDHSDYVNNLKRWKKYFPEKQIFVGFYEEIQQEPILFLERIFDFLEVDKQYVDKLEDLASKKINITSHKNIPADKLELIASYEYESIQQCHEYFGNEYTAAWLENAKFILSKKG